MGEQQQQQQQQEEEYASRRVRFVCVNRLQNRLDGGQVGRRFSEWVCVCANRASTGR